MNRLLQLRPLYLGLIVNAMVIIGVVLQEVAPSQSMVVAANVLLVCVFLGWPAMLVNSLSLHAKDRSRILVVWAAFVGTIAIHAVFVPVMTTTSGGGNIPSNALTSFVGVLGVFAPLYIFWSATRSLVGLEEKRSEVRWGRNVGTFLQFFFLPIGVFFLQKRVRSSFVTQAQSTK